MSFRQLAAYALALYSCIIVGANDCGDQCEADWVRTCKAHDTSLLMLQLGVSLSHFEVAGEAFDYLDFHVRNHWTNFSLATMGLEEEFHKLPKPDSISCETFKASIVRFQSCKLGVTLRWSLRIVKSRLKQKLILLLVTSLLVSSIIVLTTFGTRASERGWVVTSSSLHRWLLHTMLVWGSTFFISSWAAVALGGHPGVLASLYAFSLSPVFYVLYPRSLLLSLVAFVPWPSDNEKRAWQNDPKFLKNIAVVVPCHKSADGISEALTSWLKYFSPEQIILVDNSWNEKPPDDLKKVAQQVSEEIKYIYVPEGHSIQALYVGVNAMPDYKYVLLVDDDTEIPDNMVFDESFFQDDRVAGVGWARDVKEHNLLTRIVNYQLKVEFGQYRGGLLYALTGTNHHIAGTMGLYRRDLWMKIMTEHPCTPYGYDWWTGTFALKMGYRLAFDMRGSCKTYSPPILTTLCSSFERSQGFGASSLFKQRALRWNCSLMRNAPLVTWNLLTYRTGGWVEGLMFRISYIPFYILLMDFLMVTGLAAALMINPFFLFFSYFRGLVGTMSHNYILWHGAEQASLLTVLCVPLLDIIQQIFAVIGTVKCLVFDIWVYPWRVGCWKSFEHLTPADFKT